MLSREIRACRCACRQRGPRRLDAQQQAKVTEESLNRYRKAAIPFAEFLAKRFPDISGPEDFDDALMEFKQESPVSKSNFEALVAGVEYFFPNWGKLRWCRATLKGWAVEHVPRHTIPMSRAHAKLYAIHLSGLNHAKLAVGVLLQRELGLRPSEILGLMGTDVALPEHHSGAASTRAVLGLGFRTGTKAKRAQAVILVDPVLIGLLRWLTSEAVPNETLIGCSYSTYSKMLRKVDGVVKLDSGFTPHSPRAGFASESIAEGASFGDVKEAGRWVVDSSLRVYIDIVCISRINQDLRLKGLASGQVRRARRLDYFPRAAPTLVERGAQCGAEQRCRGKAGFGARTERSCRLGTRRWGLLQRTIQHRGRRGTATQWLWAGRSRPRQQWRALALPYRLLRQRGATERRRPWRLEAGRGRLQRAVVRSGEAL